ncbi:MAG TPA: hypothetical protein VMU89_09260 [Thermomicrobiaceae bacterium]|nr:hypothetical protein [Thermomicrobiaceae bacterium]
MTAANSSLILVVVLVVLILVCVGLAVRAAVQSRSWEMAVLYLIVAFLLILDLFGR